MKSMKRLLLAAVLLVVCTGNLLAQNRNDLLVLQDVEDPNQFIKVFTMLDLHQSWRDKGVRKVRVQEDGDAAGSFRKIMEFDAQGNLVRKETVEGETWSLQYGRDNNLRRVDHFNKGNLVSTQYFYYERNGSLRKSVLALEAEPREVEGYYDAKGYLTRVRHSSKGVATKTLNVQYTWNDAKQITAVRTPDMSASLLYNGNKLVQYRAEEVGKNTQKTFTYGEYGLNEVKAYDEKDGDLVLKETVAFEYNAAGIQARKTKKSRDPNAKASVHNFFYDKFEPQSVAMRGDDWDGGGYGYGTPVIISWANPDGDTRVTDSIYSLRLELKPGVGQQMPEIKELTLRLNHELTEKEIGHVVLRKEGVGDKYFIEEKLPLFEGSNAIRLDVETNLGKFSSGERFITYKNPNREIQVRDLHVLAIGIADYMFDTLDITHASADVNALITALNAQQGKLFGAVKTKVLTDKDATKANIEEAIRQIKGKAAKEDLVLIYFSGHGEEKDGNFFLKPHDVKRSRGELEASAIDNRWILEEISRYNASTLYFLDASHPVKAEGVDVGKANMDEVMQDFESVITSDDDIRIFMSSTSAKQESRVQQEAASSLYLSALLEGLKGEADKAGNNNGLVTVEELGSYVSDRVLGLTSWKQKPSHVKRGIGMVPIAKVGGN